MSPSPRATAPVSLPTLALALALTLLLAVCGAFSGAAACPYYILTPASNFSQFAPAAAAAQTTGQPLYVCDGAVMAAYEYVSPITGNLALIGVGPATGLPATFALEPTYAPLIEISSAAVVTAENIVFAFNGTLFLVQGAASLTLTRCSAALGDVAVVVATNAPAVSPAAGFVGDRVTFLNVGIAIYQSSGAPAVTCTTCIFSAPRISAVSTGGGTLAGLSIQYSFWVDYDVFVNTQAYYSASSPTTPYTVPPNWGPAHNNLAVYTPQYLAAALAAEAALAPTPIPLTGSTAPPTGSCNCTNGGGSSGGSSAFRAWQAAFIAVVLVFVVVAAVIVVVSRKYFGGPKPQSRQPTPLQ